MTKPLLIVCILLSIGAAVLGFLNRGKLEQTRGELQETQTTLGNTQRDLTGANATIEDQKKQITDLSSEKDTLSAELGEAKSELTKAKEDLAKAQEKITAAESEIATLQEDNQAKDDRIAQLEQQGNGGAEGSAGGASAPEVTELQARLSELETLNTQLQDQNTGLAAQINELQRKEENRQRMVMRQGLTGTILAVNQSWNFVVLSLGDRQGVVPNAEMLVQRGDKFLGKVRVTSVEPSTSIADILVRTVPRGFSVMPGDRVIYQSQRD